MHRINLGRSLEEPPFGWWTADIGAIVLGISLALTYQYVSARSDYAQLAKDQKKLAQEVSSYHHALKEHRQQRERLEGEVARYRQAILKERYSALHNDKSIAQTIWVLDRIRGKTKIDLLEMSQNDWTVQGVAKNHMAIAKFGHNIRKHLPKLTNLKSHRNAEKRTPHYEITFSRGKTH